jgi:hypothetical protein
MELLTFFSIPQLVLLTIEFLLFTASLSYMTKGKTTDGKLLFAGSLIGLLVHATHIILAYLARAEVIPFVSSYYAITELLLLAGSILFYIGFVQLIRRVTPKNASGFGTLDS